MTANDFRRIALSLEGAQEGAHMGAADFRVDNRIFATLASEKQGFGNIKLTLEQQTEFVSEMPDVFVPIAGGWGRMGMTHVRLAKVTADASNAGRPHPLGGPSSQHVSALGQRQKKCLTSRLS